ncbi:cilia- and flagella-associated protein 53-like [Styela clava]|uniref:cilia- and flagella-associated protein 53-like n=1 Tax=Styela clava TaxID=7725 RepID=UPI001939DFB5|nr:cilia- and flagella-associated protein 53-like [Styela clava]XP_039258079.1 cilia- and flagella-associated protein 53-like [Styela clava]
MLSFQRTRRTREHTGPTPHSVAIVAKMPSKNLPEHLILERRKREDLREEAIQITKYNKMFDLKNDWERVTDRSIQKNTVQRRVKDVLEQDAIKLEERRIRLRQLLADEEDDFIREMEEKQETMAERQEKMRERAKVLKEKREKERQEIVEQKLDQQWRNQCEELRSVLSRRHQDEVCIDRMHQLAVKSDMERMKQEEERMYADLWEKDRLMKAAREEREAQEMIKRNRAMLDVLQTQKAALEAKKQEEKRLVKEEALLLQEERELREMEEQRAIQLKREQQRAHKNALEKSMKLKGRRAAQETQEELALDMKILEQLLEESRNEAHEIAENKKRMREENQRYREYLAQMKEEERIREAEVDRLIDEDVEKMWQKKIAQWRIEREARNKLMQDVMETRKKQLQEKLVILAEQKEELRRDKEQITKAIEEHNRLEDERVARTKAINKKYESDLLGQIGHQKELREQKFDEELREYQDSLKTEAAYQARLKKVLTSPDTHDRIHPSRRPKVASLSVTGTKLQ